MDWKHLYTSFDGRIGRQQFWIGAIVLAIASIIVSFVVIGIFGGSHMMGMRNMPLGDFDVIDVRYMSQASGWASLVVFALFVWPWLALALKRRHDKGSSGRLVWVSAGLSAILTLLQATGFGHSVHTIGGMAMYGPNLVYNLISLISGIIGLYLLVVLGFLKGDEGPNSYGPDPLAQS